MEVQKLPRRERNRLQQRQEILATALDLFSLKGYHNVSMHEIASKSEFAIGTLYKFFASKEDIYRSIVLERCHDFEDAFSRIMDQSHDEVEKLRHYVRLRSERFCHDLPFVRLLLAENRGISFNLKAGVYHEVHHRYYDILKRLASIFECGIKNQRFKKNVDPFYLALTLDSAIDALLLFWLVAPDGHPYPKDLDDILEIFLNGLTES